MPLCRRCQKTCGSRRWQPPLVCPPTQSCVSYCIFSPDAAPPYSKRLCAWAITLASLASVNQMTHQVCNALALFQRWPRCRVEPPLSFQTWYTCKKGCSHGRSSCRRRVAHTKASPCLLWRFCCGQEPVIRRSAQGACPSAGHAGTVSHTQGSDLTC